MRLWNKIRSGFGREVDGGLAEEMRLHRAMLEDRFRAEGLSPDEARNRAMREFGPMAIPLEDSRAEWSFAWLESLVTDARYAVRALARNKTFSATAVLTLGVGLALASVAFTWFNAYVLRPFAVADPGALYEVHWRGKDNSVRMHPWRDYEEIRTRRDVFTDVLASRGVFVMGVTRHWSGKLVSGSYFRMLGAHIELGRAIEDRDTRTPLGDNVAVLGYGAWKSAFQLDPGVLGKKLVLRGQSYEIIGVASREFAGLDESPPDFWVPMSMHAAFRKEEMAVEVIGRLREGVSKAQAEAALGALATRGRAEWRAELDSRASVVPFTPKMMLVFSPVLLALGLVLATCCANVANMLLARGLARQREIGIRLSVGAGRARLVRQLLAEALAISILAGVVAVVLARLVLEGGLRVFYATVGTEFGKLVRLHSLELDYRVFLFALCAAVMSAVGAALLPALQATRPDLVSALRGEFGAGFRASRLRDGLVVLQVVVCAVLLVCGALLYRRAAVFQTQDTGMRQQGVINLSVEDRGIELAAEFRTLAEVEAVAVAQRAPWFGRLDETLVIPSGKSNPLIAGYNFVSPSYFRVLGIGLKSGRGFTEAEARAGAPVAIVSQATARTLWPGEEPIGKTFRAAERSERSLDKLPIAGEIRVVGVAADVTHGWVFEGRDRTCIYLPVWEGNVKQAGQMLVLMRGGENAGLRRLRERIAARWPGFAGDSIPMSAALSLQIYPFRAAAWIGWVLGLVADGVECVGHVRCNDLPGESTVEGDWDPDGSGRVAEGRGGDGDASKLAAGWSGRADRRCPGGWSGEASFVVESRTGCACVGQLRASVGRRAGGQRRGAGSARSFEPRRTRRSEYGSASRLEKRGPLVSWNPPLLVSTHGSEEGGWQMMAERNPKAEFIGAAVWHGSLERAEAMLAEFPEIAGSDIHVVAILGDDVALRRFLEADPGNATAKGGPRGGDVLTHLCFSKYLRLDRARSDAFVRAATALLDAGASANTGFEDPGQGPKPAFESVLYGAAGVAHHPEMTRVLLERGADPNDGEVAYHTPETLDNRAMRVLVESGKLTPDSFALLLARKFDWHDDDGVAWLLAHGADANFLSRWGGRPLHKALRCGNAISYFELLLDHGADPALPNQEGMSAFALAGRMARADVLNLFESRGFKGELHGDDAFLAACARADEATARAIVGRFASDTRSRF